MRWITAIVTACLASATSAQPELATAGDRAATLRDWLADPAQPGVLIGAHRGDWRNAPENSLRAIRNCIDLGLDIVEIDVRRTADGRFVLMHDKTLDRTTTGHGLVSDHALSDLAELRLTNPHGVPTREPIPTLEDALTLVKGKILIFLDKAEAHALEIEPILRATGTADQVIFFGQYQASETPARLNNLHGIVTYVPKLRPSTADPSAYLAAHLADPSIRVVEMCFERDDDPIASLMPTILHAGRRAWVSTLWPDMCGGHDDDLAIDDPAAHWGHVIAMGATIVLTDRPHDLLRYRTSAGLTPALDR